MISKDIIEWQLNRKLREFTGEDRRYFQGSPRSIEEYTAGGRKEGKDA